MLLIKAHTTQSQNHNFIKISATQKKQFMQFMFFFLCFRSFATEKTTTHNNLMAPQMLYFLLNFMAKSVKLRGEKTTSLSNW